MKTTTQRRNEFDLVVDSNRVPHIEILVDHEEGEIWAKIHGVTRLCSEITLYNGDDEIDIKGDVLHDWITGACFRTLEDLEDLKEAMEEWTAPEPDFDEPPEPELYEGPRNYPDGF